MSRKANNRTPGTDGFASLSVRGEAPALADAYRWYGGPEWTGGGLARPMGHVGRGGGRRPIPGTRHPHQVRVRDAGAFSISAGNYRCEGC